MYLVRVVTLVTVAFLASASIRTQEPSATPKAISAQPTTMNEKSVDAPEADDATANKATVFIYRPKKIVGSALEPSVFCNGVELGRMDNGRYIVLKLDPGTYKFHMTDKTNGFNVDLGRNEVIFIRFKLVTGMWKGMGSISLSNEEDGLKQLVKLKPLGTSNIKDQSMVVSNSDEAASKLQRVVAKSKAQGKKQL